MYKDIAPDEKGTIEKVEVERVTINPKLSLTELLQKLKDAQKRKEIEILTVGFEGSLQNINFTEMGFGKEKRVTIKQTGTGMSIPRKILKSMIHTQLKILFKHSMI